MIGNLLQRLFRPPAGRQLFMDDVVADGIEILPASRREWVEREMQTIAGLAAPNASGWTEAHVRHPNDDARTVASLAISFADAARTLAERLTPFDTVVTGDPNRPTPAPTAKGFGPSPLSAVAIYEAGETGTIGWIEVSLRGSDADNMALLSAIAALPTPESLLVVDWNRGRIAELGQPAALARFITPKA